MHEDDGVEIGPLVDERSRGKVQALVDDAVAQGATAQTGDSAVPGDGWCYRPTVLSGVPATARVLSEEVFGPVAPITTFRTEDEAVGMANATPFGGVKQSGLGREGGAEGIDEYLETMYVGIAHAGG